MNLYILYTNLSRKFACYASNSDRAVAKIAKHLAYDERVSFWAVAQMMDTKGAFWIK